MGNENHDHRGPGQVIERRARAGRAHPPLVSQDGPGLAVKARVLSQRTTANPIEGTALCLKRAIRYLGYCPRWVVLYRRRGLDDDPVRIWTDSDWVWDVSFWHVMQRR